MKIGVHDWPAPSGGGVEINLCLSQRRKGAKKGLKPEKPV